MKNALFGVLTIAMYTTLKSAFFILPGYLKNALFDVVNIEIVSTKECILHMTKFNPRG